MGNTASHGLQDGVVSKKEMERMQRRCGLRLAVTCATRKVLPKLYSMEDTSRTQTRHQS